MPALPDSALDRAPARLGLRGPEPGHPPHRPDRQAPPLRRAPASRTSGSSIPTARTLEAFALRDGAWTLIAALKDDDEVARPALRRHRLPALGPLARLSPMPDAPALDRAPGDARAYVTLVTNADYLPGAVALLNSLARTGTAADIVVLHTGGVDRRRPRAARRQGRPPRRLRPPADLGRLQRRPLPPRAARPRPLHQGREARLPHPARQLRQAPPLAAPLRARGLPRRRHPRPQADRPPVRLPRVLRRPERLRERRRLPPPQLRRLRRPPGPRDLRRDARPPRHPRRLLEAHRPDLPRRPSSPTGRACRSTTTCCNTSGSTCPSSGTGT